MKEIKLTQGKYALVDDDDFERVNQYKWHANCGGKGLFYYAYSFIKVNNASKRTVMHRFILNLRPDKKIQVDHINHNTLDNRKINLRLCLNGENNRNTLLRKDSITGYKGVSFDKINKKYVAQIKYNKKSYHIGRFKTAREAAIAYNEKAKELFGEFAYLNTIA